MHLKTLAIATLVAMTIAGGATASGSPVEGRWVTECGSSRHCRLLTDLNPEGTLLLSFTVTYGRRNLVPACRWLAQLRLGSDGVFVGEYGRTSAAVDTTGKLVVTNPPKDCDGLKRTATFSRDQEAEIDQQP